MAGRCIPCDLQAQEIKKRKTEQVRVNATRWAKSQGITLVVLYRTGRDYPSYARPGEEKGPVLEYLSIL